MNKIKILLLEDNESDFDLIKYELKKLKKDYIITWVKNRKEYLESLNHLLPDLLLSDYNLPDINGDESLAFLRERDHNIPFILISSTIGEEKAVNLMRNGAKDFIMKDRIKKLIPAIERELKEYENRLTAQKEHEELIKSRNELIESEHKYRTLADSGRAMIWQEDVEGSTSYFNQVWLNFTGRKLEDELGDGWINDIHPDDIEGYLSSCSVACEKKISFSLEYRLRRHDGIYRWIIDEGCPRYNTEGEYLGYIGHCLDITDRKEVEIELKNAKTIINRNPSVAFRWLNDEQWSVVYVSENVKTMLGYTSEEFYMKKILYTDLIHSEDLGKVVSEVKNYSMQSKTINFSHEFYRILSKDGTIKWVKDDTYIVRDEKGNIVCYEGIISDVTNIVKSELLISESEKKYRTLVENIPDRIERYDNKCRHIYINPSSLSISGFKYEEVIGKTHSELGYPQEDCEYWDGLIKNVFETGLTGSCINEILSEKTPRFFDWKLYPEFDKNGTVSSVLSISRDITDLKLKEMEIRNTNEKLMRAESIAKIGNWELEIKTGRIEASEGARKIYGLPMDSKLYLGEIQAIVVSDYRPMLNRALRELIDFQSDYDVEFKIITPDKQTFKDIRSIAVYDSKSRKIFGIIQDISEIKLAYQELNKLTTAVNQSPSIIVITDTDGMVEYVNPKFTEITGFTYKEVANRNPRILKSGEMSDEVYSKLWKHITLGRVWRGEFKNRKKNGEIYWEGATVTPVFDENRKIINFLKVSQDISKQKEDEEKLLISEEKFRLISENVNDVISTIDLNGNFLYISPSIKKLRGYDPEELIGTSFVDALTLESHNKVLPIFQSVVSEILNGKTDFKPIVIEIKQPCRNGSFVETEVVITIIFDENNKFRFALGVSRNIDERKKAEALLLKQKQDLERSNKELEHFAYVASHDLQEPLRIVSSFSQLLELKHTQRLNDEAKVYISYIISGARRMQKLIKGLLEYSRISTKEQLKKTVNLSEPLKDALYDLNLLIAESKAEIVTGDLLDAVFEEDQITHVFQNLIGNALKFRRDNIKCSIVIDSEYLPNENEVLVSVKDNGCGIEAKYLEKIFVIFQRLPEAIEKPGEGLGLALCKRIIERHGGKIWAESEGKNKGSVFKFTLPAEAGDEK